MKENYQKVKIPEKEEPSIDSSDNKKSKKNSKKISKKESKKNTKKEPEEEFEMSNIETEYLELVDTKKHLIEQLTKKPKSKILRNAIQECNDSIKLLVQKTRTKNAKTYHKLIHTGKKPINEIDYFKKKLSNKEQLRVMNDLKEINKHIHIEKPYRLALLDSKIPANFKAIALQKLNILRSMEPGDNEYYKIKNWVDTFMRIPFGFYKSLSVNIEDGIDKCHDFMDNSIKQLDKCVYGLNNAKLQIMQMIGQWITNPSSIGSAIAIHGPPGCGKTSIVKDGISKILGREFAFISLGGTGDSSFLEGHSYTYEGSMCGKIVQILIQSKCMNPVIYFDELDKISDTPRGEEIAGILTHLTDSSQNSEFHDKYFSEIDFDLSKCLFIFSYNDESKVNPILRDRMYRIETKGYEAKEKLIIARDYLLPKIRELVKFNETDVVISDDIIQYIVSNQRFTKGEAGVRNLKRCLEIIYTKLNLFRLIKPDANLFDKDMDMKVEFPFVVTKKHVDIFIKNEEQENQSMMAMYV
jgi:ATP-dependent Lon protease